MFSQILVSLFLLNFTVSRLIDTKELQSRLDIISSQGDYFVLKCVTDPLRVQEIFDREAGRDELKELYDYITYNFNSFSYWTETHSAFPHQNNLQDVTNIIFATDSFIEFFDITPQADGLSAGACFDSDITPIILGHSLNDFYYVGQRFTVGTIEFQVMDFLQESQSYFDVLSDIAPICLNYGVLSTIPQDDFVNYIGLLFNIRVEAASKAELQKVQEKSNEKNLFVFEFFSFQEQFDLIYYDDAIYIQFLLFVSLSILIFCIVSMISNLLQFLDANKRAFVVHILCGATIRNVMLRISIQVFVVILLCIITLNLSVGFNDSAILTSLLAIIVGVVILMFPIIKLTKTDFVDLLK